MTSAPGGREAQQRLVELVALEGLEALLALGLLAHADPDVRVDDVGALDRLARRPRSGHAAAEGAARLEHVLPAGSKPGRRGHDARRAAQGGQEQDRVADVVAVADPRQPQPGEVQPALPQREEVGDRLTGVLEIARAR